jgi:hypothetical protein
MKNSLNNPNSTTYNRSSRSLIDFMINDPETQMRIGNKESEEAVKKATKDRRLSAPLSTEEKVLLSH